MPTFDLIKARPCHIDPIARNIRPSDRDEVWCQALVTPEEALQSSLSHSTLAWTGLVDGEPFCMFGVAATSSISRYGIPWLLGSTKIDRYSLTFLKRSKACLKPMADQYPILSNIVDARNLASIQWLKWMGFSIKPAKLYGPFNQLFHPFELRR